MDLRQFIRKIPKTETHLHIEGALPWSFLQEIDPVKYGEVPFFREPSFRYNNFTQFESILIDHAISELNVKRIQHGVAARESESLINKILDLDVCLDMCPISNYKLRVVDDWTDHPLGLFLDKGIRCTISTDDPLSFNNSLEDEYFACVDKLGLPTEKLIEVAKNGFHVADLPESKKQTFMQEIDQAWKEFSNHDSGGNF